MAIDDRERRLSYGELDTRSNRLAHHLRDLGVGRDRVVAVHMERCAEHYVALLAVLKAGGAYLALDPGYPPARTGFMLADSGADVLITREALSKAFPPAGGRAVVRLDTDAARLAARPATAPPDRTDAGDLAYVVYTSASTGPPKGVMVEHAALANLCRRHATTLGLTVADRGSLLMPLGFDGAVVESWPLLMTGASTVVVDDETRKDVAALVRLFRDERMTVADLPTALAEVFLEHPDVEMLALRYLVTGGEVLRRRPRPGMPFQVLNIYGPAETAVYVTSTMVADTAGESGPIPIGRPIGGVEVRLLDERGGPVPDGEPGEVHIGGIALARGYLGRPELTARRFVDDPAGPRLYRTGDLARRRPDGELEFLGRSDRQVKIRGHRIEPAAVESALLRHPMVRQVVVDVHRPNRETAQLTAYVVLAPEGVTATTAELRSFLSTDLPAHEIPDLVVVLDRLPLTPAGKVDRNALPSPAEVASAEPVAPRSAVEEAVAEIVAEVLGIERVGVHDDLTSLGANSLTLMQVTTRISAAFGVEIPLRRLFEDPVVAAVAARVVDAIGGDALVDPPSRAAAGHDGVPRRPGGGPAPLSFAQQRLWFLHELHPQSVAYNVASAHRLVGPLDVDCLRRALGELVRRHTVLRSTVDIDAQGVATQVVHPCGPVELSVTEADGDSPSDRSDDARELAHEFARRPFDLRRGPVLRAGLVRLDATDHVLLLCLHHIVVDQWTTGLLLGELSVLYDAFLRGVASPLSEPAVDYADFAVWQRERFDHGGTTERREYWRGRLAGLRRLALPTDRPRPAAMSFAGARSRTEVPPPVVAELERLAEDNDATLFMVVVAGIGVLLARHCGQDDVAIGAAIANRTSPELERVVGFFANTLVLRIDVSGDPSVAELLRRVRETALDAYEHQDVPFESVVRDLRPDRDPGSPPLVNVVLSFLNAPAEPLDLPGVAVTELAVDSGSAKFDLDILVARDGDALTVDVDYRTDLFDPETVRRMFARFVRLLGAMSERPESPVTRLPLLDEREYDELLVWGSGAAPSASVGRSLPELFAEQAAARSEAPAVRAGERVVTYRELDAWTDRVARALRARGVGPEVCVGVCVQRSIEAVAALLGVVKAGGCYLPLDPSYPAERLAFMLGDSAAAAVVTVGAEGVPGWRGTIVSLEELNDDGEVPPEPTPTVAPENLAYVMYTSGSTGTPKRVAVPHRAVVRLVCDTDCPRLGPDDRVAHASSTSFDAATLEIWGALLNGGELVVVSRETALEPRTLVKELRERRITVLWLTASLFDHTVREVPDAVATVGTVLVGGEALTPSTIRRVLREGAPGRLLNGYGPTENTTFTTVHHIEPDDGLAGSVPIGRPIAGGRVHIVDENLRPVPPGVPGELCVGGLGLARGYAGRPGATAERFVANPFGPPGGRIYRTGDMVRWARGGVLEFLGRRDRQVQLRGHRVEPAEVEARLRAMEGVGAAVVALRDDDGEQRLVGYVVPVDDREPPLEAELRAWAEKGLPRPLVPGAFVVLPELPLTTGGKVDRARLPAPERTDGPEGAVPPRGDTQTAIAEVWTRVLGVDRVGARENFFDLGGHSLPATRAVTVLRRRLEVNLTVRDLFDHPTVEALASVIAARSMHDPPIGPSDGPPTTTTDDIRRSLP